MGTQTTRNREAFIQRMKAWRAKTGKCIRRGFHDDSHTMAAKMQMAHKPYGHYDEIINRQEPERDGADW